MLSFFYRFAFRVYGRQVETAGSLRFVGRVLRCKGGNGLELLAVRFTFEIGIRGSGVHQCHADRFRVYGRRLIEGFVVVCRMIGHFLATGFFVFGRVKWGLRRIQFAASGRAEGPCTRLIYVSNGSSLVTHGGVEGVLLGFSYRGVFFGLLLSVYVIVLSCFSCTFGVSISEL